MKIDEIAQKYDIADSQDFIRFLKENKHPYHHVKGIPDNHVENCVSAYRINLNFRQRQNAEKAAKAAAMAQMLISSGFSFDGYRITRYSGYISGDDAVQIPRSSVFNGYKNGTNLTDALVKIRRQALMELKEAAYNLGCNAVVGVDFDYITLEPETANFNGGTLYEPYVICVTANGNAVVIEKIEDDD